nr:hypothetical protein D5086_0000059460 [Ipomoea batatas]
MSNNNRGQAFNFTSSGRLSEDFNSQWLLDRRPVMCRICDHVCPNSLSLLHHIETHQVGDVTLSIHRNGIPMPIDQSQSNRYQNPNQSTLMPQISQNQINHFALRGNVPNVSHDQIGIGGTFQTTARNLENNTAPFSAFVPILNEPSRGNSSNMSSISHLPNNAKSYGLGLEMPPYSPSIREDFEQNCIHHTRPLVMQLEKPIEDATIIGNEEDEAGMLDLNLKL